MLSRKYYNEFARIFGESQSKKDIIDRSIDMFKEDNPRFDVMRFEQAIRQNASKKMSMV